MEGLLVNDMRRAKRLDGLIKKRWRFADFREERASIVLEAAIVMPMLMLFMLALIVLIHLNAVQLALHASAAQTVRAVSAHWYPVDQALQKLARKSEQSAVFSDTEQGTKGEKHLRELASAAAKWLPDPSGTLLSSAIKGDWQPAINMAATELGRFAVEPLVRQYADARFLTSERIMLEQLSIPDYKNKQQAELGLTVSYRYPIKVPLLQLPIILHAGAAERVWIPDTAAADIGTSVSGQQHLSIISIEPSPVRPGRKATVTVMANPGEAVSLEVFYKSGLSKAKHLGEAQADASGMVSWTWHVSGNTTPGLWEVSAASISRDGARDHKFFAVKK